MGNQNSNTAYSSSVQIPRKHTPQPIFYPPRKDIVKKMAQKVLIRQEELYRQHATSSYFKTPSECHTQRDLGIETDLYYEFLTSRQSQPSTTRHLGENSNALNSQEKSMTDSKNVNSKYSKAAFINSHAIKDHEIKKLNESKTATTLNTSLNQTIKPKSRVSIRHNDYNIIANRKTIGKTTQNKVPIKRPNKAQELNIDTHEDIGSELENEPPVVQLCKNTPRMTPFSNGKPPVKIQFEQQNLKIAAIAAKNKAPHHRSIALRQRKAKNDELPQFDKVSLLPANIFMEILAFSVDSFRNLLMVNPSWYHAGISALDTHFNATENSFVCMYSEYLLFKDSYTASTVMKFCDMGAVRIDRVIKCENIETTVGKTLLIGFTYQFYNEKKYTYKCEYMFDSTKKGTTCMWIHKNECDLNSEDSIKANTQPVVPVCEGDNIEIAIPFYSLRGLIDLSTIKWMPPKLLDTPLENVLNYRREEKMEEMPDKSEKLMADLGRVSELEDSQVVWRYVDNQAIILDKLQLSEITQWFSIEELENSNVDIYVAKIRLRAIKKGEVPYEIFGITIKVKEKGEDCTREIKRVGLLIERHCDLELRIGDILVAYITKPAL